MQNPKGQALIEALLVLFFCITVFLFVTYVLIQSLNRTTTTTVLGRLNYCLSSFDRNEKECLSATKKKLEKTCLLCDQIKISYLEKIDRRIFRVIWQNKFVSLFNLGIKIQPETKNEFELRK